MTNMYFHKCKFSVEGKKKESKEITKFIGETPESKWISFQDNGKEERKNSMKLSKNHYGKLLW